MYKSFHRVWMSIMVFSTINSLTILAGKNYVSRWLFVRRGALRDRWWNTQYHLLSLLCLPQGPGIGICYQWYCRSKRVQIGYRRKEPDRVRVVSGANQVFLQNLRFADHQQEHVSARTGAGASRHNRIGYRGAAGSAYLRQLESELGRNLR